MAATYSRGVYKTTTIGKAAFDGRVRDGNGSVRSFMVTKKVIGQTGQTCRTGRTKAFKERCRFLSPGVFSENYIQAVWEGGGQISNPLSCKVAFLNGLKKEEAIKPHDRLVLVRCMHCCIYTPSLSTR